MGMGSMDLVNSALVQLGLTPATVITSNTTTTGIICDRLLDQTNGNTHLVLLTGNLLDGSFAVQVYEGDASNMSDEAAISGATVTIAATDDLTVKFVAFKRTKRYLRFKIVSTSCTSGGNIAGCFISPLTRGGATGSVP